MNAATLFDVASLPDAADTYGLPRDRFNSAWRARCYVDHIDTARADWMIQRHYLGKWPSISRCVLAMHCGQYTLGVIVFADAPQQTSVRYSAYTWELARLWIVDEAPRNAETWFIGQAIKHVTVYHPQVEMLVSYADPSAGHCGTIYRASNWTFDGMTDEGRKSPRVDYVVNGVLYSRKAHVPAGVAYTRQPRVSKYRYTMRLKRPAPAVEVRR